MNTAKRPLRQPWFAVFFFSCAIFFSLGLGDQRADVYRANISPALGSDGVVNIVFFGKRYEEYLASGKLQVPHTDWQVRKAADSTTLVASGQAQPLNIYTNGQPIEVGLLSFAQGGVVRLVDGGNAVKLISLRSSAETVLPITIGGSKSAVQPSGFIYKNDSVALSVGVFAFVFVLLMCISFYHSKGAELSKSSMMVNRCEICYFSIPLLLSTTLILFTYFPASVAYDGSLQWVQAATRGELDAPLGVTATLFMRLFSQLSPSPIWLIVLQSALSALGVALIMLELRYRGVPLAVAVLAIATLAITPQYPTFFTTLGKDALSTVGLLFFAWSLLVLFKNAATKRIPIHCLFILVISSAFAGVMRANVMPIVMLVMGIAMLALFRHYNRTKLTLATVAFVALSLLVPRVAFHFSEEQLLARAKVTDDVPTKEQEPTLPLGMFANLYIYHLFSAAVGNGIPLSRQDTVLFYRIAPQDAWARYDCNMTDATFIEVSKQILMDPQEYKSFLQANQLELAKAVVRIISANPAVLFDRQACISRILWYVGYGQKPFQTTATLGYDSVDQRFRAIVGENRSLLPEQFRTTLQKYLLWTESEDFFWLFWKPALVTFFSLFVISLYLRRTHDTGVLVVVLIPYASTLLLALVIPFPAYRYQFPSVLLMFLLCTLAFSRHVSRGARDKIGF